MNIHWKDSFWSWSSNTLANWCKELTHWKRHWCWERLRARGEGQKQRIRWLDSITDWMDTKTALTLGDSEEWEAWHSVVCGVTKSWTWLSDWIRKAFFKNWNKDITKFSSLQEYYLEFKCLILNCTSGLSLSSHIFSKPYFSSKLVLF